MGQPPAPDKLRLAARVVATAFSAPLRPLALDLAEVLLAQLGVA